MTYICTAVLADRTVTLPKLVQLCCFKGIGNKRGTLFFFSFISEPASVQVINTGPADAGLSLVTPRDSLGLVCCYTSCDKTLVTAVDAVFWGEKKKVGADKNGEFQLPEVKMCSINKSF